MSKTHLARLGWGAYGVAFFLLLIPLADSVMGVWPLRVGDVTWRFGAVGLFSRAIMTPLLGLLVGLTTAILLEHRVMARVFAVLGVLGMVLALTGIGFFTLDALQTRARVRPEAAGAFDAASVVAVLKYLFGAVVALLLAIGGWKASRTRPGGGRESRGGEASRVLISAERPEEPETD